MATRYTEEFRRDAVLDALLQDPDVGDGAIEGEDDVPEAPEDPVSRPGDLLMLGYHRLLFGDATVASDVERVLGTVRPQLMVFEATTRRPRDRDELIGHLRDGKF